MILTSNKKLLCSLSILTLLFTLSCNGGSSSSGSSGGSSGGSSSGGSSTGGGPSGGSSDASSGGTNFTSTTTWACNDSSPVSFPGAEGFGQCATGARSSSATVCSVTSTATDTDGTTPGTLQYCLNQEGPAYIIFKTSGLIDSDISSIYPDKTIAGQTSPNGIVMRGFQCDNGVWESTYRCNNMIIRHIRSRPLSDGEFPDAFRFSGAKNVIVDHSSFENATDETVEFTRSSYVTLQDSIIAEPVGDHYRYGGMLINYSDSLYSLGPLSLHHNFIGRSGGRYPEISCEENNDGPGTSNCSGRTLQFEISSNLIFDQEEAMVYNHCTGTNAGNDCSGSSTTVNVALNWKNNRHMVRSSYDSSAGIIYAELFNVSGNGVFASGNSWNLDSSTDTSLASDTVSSSESSAYNYPSITTTASSAVPSYITTNAGAFPRDTMDTRILSYISDINASPRARTGSTSDGDGIQVGDAHTLVSSSRTFPTDTDGDGMPDCWETAHGLNPNVQDHNGTDLSSNSSNGITGCTAGYSNIECFINEVAANRVGGNYIPDCGV